MMRRTARRGSVGWPRDTRRATGARCAPGPRSRTERGQRMSMSDRETSGWAVGWTFFAAFMMIMIGVFHAIAGFAAILEDEFLSIVPAIGTETQGDVYFLQLDAS